MSGIFFGPVFKLKLYTFDLCLAIVQFVEHYVQGETQLGAKLDVSQLNNRLLCPVVPPVRFRDVILQEKAFDLVFYTFLFISELIVKPDDLPVEFLPAVAEGDFDEQIILLKKRCFLDSVFFTVIPFTLVFAGIITANRMTCILSNYPRRRHLGAQVERKVK